jgi:hypothetical protein
MFGFKKVRAAVPFFRGARAAFKPRMMPEGACALNRIVTSRIKA